MSENFATMKVIENKNSHQLTEFLETEGSFGGIEFDDKLMDISELPKKFNYSLRFLEFHNFRWVTNHIRRQKKLSNRPRNYHDNEGGSYSYFCFLSVQNSIDRAYMKIMAPDFSFPNVTMQVSLQLSSLASWRETHVADDKLMDANKQTIYRLFTRLFYYVHESFN